MAMMDDELDTREEIRWGDWPKNRPKPTQAEWDAANERYREEAKEAIANGYCGDFYCGLGFAIATYGRMMWWPLFFPDEPCPSLETEP